MGLILLLQLFSHAYNLEVIYWNDCRCYTIGNIWLFDHISL